MQQGISEHFRPNSFGLRSYPRKRIHKMSLSRYRVSTSLPCTASLAQVKRGWMSHIHHHVISLDVIVMCLTLKCMQTSKVQIQAHNMVWSVCLLVLVMLTFCGHFVTYFDMVAELVRTKVHKIRKIIQSMTKTTITSSSGERRRFKWNLNLKEGADVNMFAHDHRVPGVPQPTSFDGVKPSFLEWSEEVIAYLAVTDYHEFIPLLSVAAASKDVIEKDVMFKGSCQRTWRISTRSPLKSSRGAG